jgi:hypothetical protein
MRPEPLLGGRHLVSALQELVNGDASQAGGTNAQPLGPSLKAIASGVRDAGFYLGFEFLPCAHLFPIVPHSGTRVNSYDGATCSQLIHRQRDRR